MKNNLKIIPVIFINLFLLGCTTEKKNNDLIRANLNGSIESIKASEYTVVEKFGEIQKDILERETVYKYDEGGNLMEKLDKWRKDIYQYNDNEVLLAVSTYNLDGSLAWKTINKYSDKGILKELNYYNPDGSLHTKEIFEYDANGDYTGTINYFNTYFAYKSRLFGRGYYDDKYKDSDSVTYKEVNHYNSNGNKKVENEYGPDGTLNSSNIYSYNSNASLIEHIWYERGGHLIFKIINRYNTRGDILEENHYYPDGSSTFTYRYVEYDKKDNWFRRIKFANEKPINITEREIVYY